MSSNTLYEPELPPYEVCSKPSYTKENIDEFKEQLESIENELLNITNKNDNTHIINAIIDCILEF